MSEVLKPCPDCNNTVIELCVDDDGEVLYRCESCGFCSPWAKNAVEAKQKWNSLPRKGGKQCSW